jgi:(4S)-4-hydroxy-5-phosphonooxypentane-2,3-dione isomerase
MLAIVVEFRIAPAFIDGFERAIVANATASREKEPGCRQFDVCRDPADPQLFFLYELYDDAAAFDAHCRTAHFLEMEALTAGWVQSKAVHRYLRASP